MYTLPIMLESERQAVYRERERKKGCTDKSMAVHYDIQQYGMHRYQGYRVRGITGSEGTIS